MRIREGGQGRGRTADLPLFRADAVSRQKVLPGARVQSQPGCTVEIASGGGSERTNAPLSWENVACDGHIGPTQKGIRWMQLSHARAAVSARFDDPNLVSCAGLVPVMALAKRCGLAALLVER